MKAKARNLQLLPTPAETQGPLPHRLLPTAWRGVTGAGLTSGLLLTLAYPPFGLWPLAMVACVPLLLWTERDRPTAKAAFLAGLLAGTVLHGLAWGFLTFTLREMSGIPTPLGAAVVLLLAAAMGLHQAVFAWLVALTVRDRASTWPLLARALAVGLLYAAVEFALPFLFPWHLGNTLYAAPVWIQTADLVGVTGVSLLCALVSALIALAWLHRPQRWRLMGALAVVLALWAGYGFLRLAMIESAPVRRTLVAAMVQGNATLTEKRSEAPKVRLPMLDREERLTRALDLTGVDLLIWPEGALPFFWVTDAVGPAAAAEKHLPTRARPVLREAKARALAVARDLQKPLLFGTLRRPDRLWQQEARNSAVLAQPDGATWLYDKRILLPFGEYLPGSSLVPALKESIKGVSHMDPGTTSGRVEVAGVKLLVTICYEALFARFMRDEAGDADVLVNLTNDIWFGPDAAPELHLMVQAARPVELRRPLLRSTVTGITAHVDASGVIRQRTGLNVEATVRAVVPVRDLGSPYRLWGDGPMWGMTLAAAAYAWVNSRKKSA